MAIIDDRLHAFTKTFNKKSFYGFDNFYIGISPKISLK